MSDCNCHRVYGASSYCNVCHQQQFPEDCCVCNGKNLELKKRLDEDKKEFLDMINKHKQGSV